MDARHILTRTLLGASLAAALPAALGAETVIGSPRAETCFQSALSGDDSLPAIELCTAALLNDPLAPQDRAATYVNRGILQSRRGRHQDAYDDFSRALEMERALVHALINRGNVLVRMKRYDEALTDYDRAVFYSEGRDPLVFFNRSLAYENLGRGAEAREDLVRAVQLDPESPAYREALAAIE
ncbi:MAG: tetratricopeptide repeat protein [Pseudomonadales bacterium]|jgi:tetratricopeptide (TPR) repeat protein|nr:tetratricopeptide repeat protein [Pseudomonadales bacterium]